MTERPSTTWQLRRATPDDLDAIMAIEDAVFTPDAWSRDSMRNELGLRDGYYLVAFPVGEPDQIDAYAGLFAPAPRAVRRRADHRGRRSTPAAAASAACS